MSDVTIDVNRGRVEVHENSAEPWKITLVDTGDDTGTGGRLKQVLPYVAGEECFHFTYGDGVGNVDIDELTAFHRSHKRMATVTAAKPPHRFGVLQLDGERVKGFEEKPEDHGGWVNAGFFVLTPAVDDMIDGNQAYWEREPIERIVAQDHMRAFLHRGFWQPMDTLRDKETLERLWISGKAPWKIW
jgi:glucose-1-phosphate cytidylyltransferase